MKTLDFLRENNACPEGSKYATQYENMADVWDNCEKLDWLLWICRKLPSKVDNSALRLFACYCVRNTPSSKGKVVWDLLTDPRSRAAVETAERFAIGEATIEEVRTAHADAADAAEDAAYAAYAADAAYAAAAAYAAYAAAYADAAADAAAYTASASASTAAADAADAAAADAAAVHAAKSFQLEAFKRMVPNPFKVN